MRFFTPKKNKETREEEHALSSKPILGSAAMEFHNMANPFDLLDDEANSCPSSSSGTNAIVNPADPTQDNIESKLNEMRMNIIVGEKPKFRNQHQHSKLTVAHGKNKLQTTRSQTRHREKLAEFEERAKLAEYRENQAVRELALAIEAHRTEVAALQIHVEILNETISLATQHTQQTFSKDDNFFHQSFEKLSYDLGQWALAHFRKLSWHSEHVFQFFHHDVILGHDLQLLDPKHIVPAVQAFTMTHIRLAILENPLFAVPQATREQYSNLKTYINSPSNQMAEIKKWEISTLNLLMGREDQLACEADYLKSVAEHIDSCLRQMTNHNSGQDSRISRLGKIIDLARSVARETAKLSTDIVYVTGRDISPLFRAEEMIDVANPYEEPDRKRRVAAVISPLILRLNCNKDGSEGSVILSKARVFLAPL